MFCSYTELLQTLQLKYFGEEIPSELPEVAEGEEDAAISDEQLFEDDDMFDEDEPLFGEGSFLDEEADLDEEFESDLDLELEDIVGDFDLDDEDSDEE